MGSQRKKTYDRLSQIRKRYSFIQKTRQMVHVCRQKIPSEKPTVEIRARPSGAAQVVRVAEALKRLGYVSYDKYFTTSEVQEGNLLRFIVVRLRKTDNFDKLYAERETERQTKMAEKEAENKK